MSDQKTDALMDLEWIQEHVHVLHGTPHIREHWTAGSRLVTNLLRDGGCDPQANVYHMVVTGHVSQRLRKAIDYAKDIIMDARGLS